MIRPTKFEIVCDGCGEVYRDLMSSEWSDPKNGIEDAVEHGWIKKWATKIPWGRPKHFCPKCRKERGL